MRPPIKESIPSLIAALMLMKGMNNEKGDQGVISL